MLFLKSRSAVLLFVVAMLAGGVRQSGAQPTKGAAVSIPPNQGVDLFQMSFFPPDQPPDLNTDTCKAVVDIDQITEFTSQDRCYLNIITNDGKQGPTWRTQNLQVNRRVQRVIPPSAPGRNQVANYFRCPGPPGVSLLGQTIQTLVTCGRQPMQTIPENMPLNPYAFGSDAMDISGVQTVGTETGLGDPPATHEDPPKGDTTSFIQPEPVNIDAAINQCVPMSTANSLQWLENRYGIQIPHAHKIGQDGDDSLVGQLDEAMERNVTSRNNGGATFWAKWLPGKFSYLSANNLSDALVHRRQGRANGFVPAGDITSSGITAVDDGENVTWQWLCDQLNAGEDVELAYAWPGGGHAVRVTGCGKTEGREWIKYIHDSKQGFDNGVGLETVDVYIDKDLDMDGRPNFGAMDKNIIYAISESANDERKQDSEKPWTIGEFFRNAADFTERHARGGIAALAGVFNSIFSPEKFLVASADGTPITLPTTLQGVTVYINGRESPMYSANTFQLNFQIPYETEAGLADVVVEVDGATTAAFTITVDEVAPAIIILPEQFAGPDRAIAQNFPSFTLNTPDNPVEAGGVIIVYMVGIGETTNPVPTGQAALGGEDVSVAIAPYSATIGGMDAAIPFLGLTPGAVGLGQANIVVPADLPSGNYLVVVTVGGVASNALLISVVNNG